ncbi:hypothetical protein GCM10023221_26750 [Luteimicrobium xylanilyticum]|uniref:Uncharacterized protein n=1 Tax=Luteimicrobium xylanilyticum TaxID=1133546 RepID=A0A5P9QFC4_9MICO|nr:DUF805 domain-containing protein [Luteimicrobium xylanilyticum]QFU99802.1 hypothetical protein KDY119_03338 [Luteimicrobium xylanilyticum]
MENDTTVSDWAVSGAGIAVILVAVAFWVLFLVAGIRVIQKAGYSGWWILVTFVPLLNTIMFLVFAFSRWPVERELAAWRTQAQTPPPPGMYGQPGGPYPG